MRSCVRCGIDLAAGERLMTRETVAGESWRCSGRKFRLTDGAEACPRSRENATSFDRGMGCIVRVVSHKKRCGGKRQSEFLRECWGLAAAIQGPQTPEKSIYQARSSTVHYGFFSYIPLDTAARPGVSCLAGVE